MEKLIFAILLFSSLTGCGSRGFVKPGTSYSEFLESNDYCKARSAQYNGGQWDRDLRNECMEQLGYEITRDEKAWRPPNDSSLAEALIERERRTIYFRHY